MSIKFHSKLVYCAFKSRFKSILKVLKEDRFPCFVCINTNYSNLEIKCVEFFIKLNKILCNRYNIKQ